MSDSFDAFSDDFFVNVDLQTSLPLPESRETILQFCEACQKQFVDMSTFYRRDTGEFVLEGDRDAGSYRWMELEARRLSAGYFNPPEIEQALFQHRWILDRCTYYLGVSHLDVESLDVVFGYNLDFQGNRDAVVAEALLADSPLAGLAEEAGLVPLAFEPSFIVALDRECYLQARLNLETRGNSYQIRTGNYDDEPISVYFTVRSYPAPGKKFDMRQAFDCQVAHAQDLAQRIVIPRIIQPIVAAIASSQ
ncbi:MAG: hypothetical protein HQ546_11425 [Planctomycetes bacterium]|nr:hypothetical protein [Planctomycetota bacterium]